VGRRGRDRGRRRGGGDLHRDDDLVHVGLPREESTVGSCFADENTDLSSAAMRVHGVVKNLYCVGPTPVFAGAACAARFT
jgi:hypothetical protein